MRTNRLICMVMAAAMMASAAVASAADRNEGDKGTFVGTVAEKGANNAWFRANNNTASERFMPRWVGGLPANGGSLDQDLVAKIKDLKRGDKVEVKWEFTEHLRALDITILDT